MTDDTERNDDVQDTLAKAWFTAIEELRYNASVGENTADRIAAADAILRYCIALGQSINQPYYPEKRPDIEEEDE